MTVPGYLYGTGVRLASDARLKGYQYYQKLLADQIRAQTHGISMSVELSSDFTSYKTLKVNDTYAEMPSTSGLNAYLSRTGADVTLYDEARLIVHLISAGAGMPNYAVEYSLDAGVSWDFLDGVSGPYVEAYPETAPHVFMGDWVTVDALAKTDAWLRLVGKNDEVTPAVKNSRVGIVSVEFRTIYVNQYPTWTYDEYIDLAALNGWPPYGSTIPPI